MTTIDDIYFEDLAADYPDVDKHSCRLLGPTALVVQGLMGILVVLSLVYKRQREKPMRPWKIWVFDVSKQVAGQMFVHGANVFLSSVVARHASGNPCVLYFLNILIDTTIGVGVIFVVHRSLTHFLSERLKLSGFVSGQYGEPPSILFWLRQAMVYILALTVMKLFVIFLFVIFPGIFRIGEWLLRWTRGKGSVQVIFVMGIFPIIMNIMQFWLIDSIVKASATHLDQTPGVATRSSIEEPLFHGSDDDDDDFGAHVAGDLERQQPLPVARITSAPSSLKEDEQKSLPSSSATPIPGSRNGLAGSSHSYPPSRSTSPSSFASSSFSSRVMSRSPESNRPSRKRTLPPPLNIQPSVSSIVVSSSPLQSTLGSRRYLEGLGEARVRQIVDGGGDLTRPAAEMNWGIKWDDTDDWADRVGEEDWTGRRLVEKRGTIEDVWNGSRHITVS